MSSNKNIFVPKEGAYSGSWRRPAGAAGECGALHIAYRSKLGRLEVIEDGIDFLFELEPIDAGTQHVRSYTVDTPECRAGAIFYALGPASGFVIELTWVTGVSVFVLFDDEGEALDFLLTRGMPFVQATLAAAVIPSFKVGQ